MVAEFYIKDNSRIEHDYIGLGYISVPSLSCVISLHGKNEKQVMYIYNASA